uniref:Uncharacterized protein n=1 Tax=Anopheles farauti TaxID=69004 RepID=A0A182Q039_9DIPT
MKSFITLVFLVVCATQAYSYLYPGLDCAGSHLRYGDLYGDLYGGHHLGYASTYSNHVYGLPCHGHRHHLPHRPCKTCQGCRSCKTKSSELYPCPYRKHGPCECQE